MKPILLVLTICALAPAVLMAAAALMSVAGERSGPAPWRSFYVFSRVGLLFALVAPALQAILALPVSGTSLLSPWSCLATGPLSAWIAVLVQLLGSIVGAFSARYLEGEPRQRAYLTSLAGVLSAVQLLLLANHWLVLIAAWALAGAFLQNLLCFYAERPMALLAAHKKRIADRMADALLLGAAGLAWKETGSGSLAILWQHLAGGQASTLLQLAALCLAMAVILRTGLFPAHGWLTQVMEAPTPVSALLHAGVVNLGGFVLIRFAPLLEAAAAARWLLVGFGLATAILAGLVMLTRVSIKVRLAWSTVAQMGFMVLECGLGLYTLAALHLLGHSLYKAHAFLSASTVVRQSKLQAMHGRLAFSATSLLIAPVTAVLLVVVVQAFVALAAAPWWWSGVLALAWAPLLWLPPMQTGEGWTFFWRVLAGIAMVAGLTAAACMSHVLPLGTADAPCDAAGIVALHGMGAMYLCLVVLQLRPRWLGAARRWSYAGFYVDEFYTRLALRIWPTKWIPPGNSSSRFAPITAFAGRVSQ